MEYVTPKFPKTYGCEEYFIQSQFVTAKIRQPFSSVENCILFTMGHCPMQISREISLLYKFVFESRQR